MKKNTKRTLIIAGLTAALISYYKYDYPYHPNYVITEDDVAFGEYSNGKVYIGPTKYINSISHLANENDILIMLGYEHKKDGTISPVATIISSYRIRNMNERYEILSLLDYYKVLNETEWERSLETMRVEWTLHNILYDLHVERDRTKNVDLDNSSEELYDNKFIKRLVK